MTTAQFEGQPGKQVDHSTIPPAIRRSAAEAERLQRESTGQIEPQPPEQLATPPAPEQPATPPAPEQLTLEQRLERAEQASKSWEGRLRKANEEITGLRQLLATVSTVAPPAPQNMPEVPAELKFEPFTAQEEQELGPEFLAAVKRQAALITAPVVQRLEQRFAELDGRVKHAGERAVVSDHERMRQHLNDQVPNWLTVNDDDDFKDWCTGIDDLSGQQRQSMLLDAWNANDGARVARFFKKFLDGQTPLAPQAPGGNGSQAPAPAKPSLESFAAPGRGAPGSSPAPAPADRRLYRASEITKFYADRAAGKYKGREQEAQELERDIFAAQGENRIVGG